MYCVYVYMCVYVGMWKTDRFSHKIKGRALARGGGFILLLLLSLLAHMKLSTILYLL